MSTAGHEAAANAPTAGEYIVHHLTHLNTTGHAQKDIIDFTVLNVDTLVFSLLMGILGLFVISLVFWAIERLDFRLGNIRHREFGDA